VNAREGEEAIDADTLAAGLAEVNPDELTRAREALVRARDALAGIRTVCIREAGFDKAPAFERLPAALDGAIAMIGSVTGDDAAPADGADAVAGDEAAADTGAGTVTIRLPAGAVANREEAVEAMHVAERYFALREPSSPVPILLREAQSASGKTFYELVNELLPESAEQASISLGRDIWFDVRVSTLDARNPAPDYSVEEHGHTAAENAGIGDDEIGGDAVAELTKAGPGAEDNAPPGDPDGEPAATEDVPAAPPEAETESEDASRADTPEATHEIVGELASSEPTFVANSRPEAVALLEKVLAYYRVAEPTSPVPLLVERAIELSSKSFIDLLGSVLPEGALKAKGG
jgi:type VI secretion system protein ImpA